MFGKIICFFIGHKKYEFNKEKHLLESVNVAGVKIKPFTVNMCRRCGNVYAEYKNEGV